METNERTNEKTNKRIHIASPYGLAFALYVRCFCSLFKSHTQFFNEKLQIVNQSILSKLTIKTTSSPVTEKKTTRSRFSRRKILIRVLFVFDVQVTKQEDRESAQAKNKQHKIRAVAKFIFHLSFFEWNKFGYIAKKSQCHQRDDSLTKTFPKKKKKSCSVGIKRTFSIAQ